MSALPPQDCSRCCRSDGEIFTCMKSRYEFDVDEARQLAGRGHDVMELDPEDVVYSVGRCQINEGHVPHVNPEIPGIVAHIYFPDEDGTLAHGHRLIDGHHRAARCLQLGIPFPVRVLSEEESLRVLNDAPPEVWEYRRQRLAAGRKKVRGKRRKARREAAAAG